MEYNSKETHCHIIQPIAYNQIRKTCKPRKHIHSAYEQYSIHCIAHQFVSDVLKIPKPHYCESYYSYVMDQIPDYEHIPVDMYGLIPELVVAILSFTQYMITNGVWPRNFSIFHIGNRQFILLDFSRFGYISSNRVKFPKESETYTLCEASLFFGIQFYTNICDTAPPSSPRGVEKEKYVIVDPPPVPDVFDEFF